MTGRPALELTHPVEEVHVKGDPLGRSYTRLEVARAVLYRLRELMGARGPIRMWEPCLGGGAWVITAHEVFEVEFAFGSDVDEAAPGRKLVDRFAVADATKIAPPERLTLTVTNPPFGLEVGQEVTLAILRAARRAATWCVMLMPVDYQTQAGFEADIAECVAIWPVLPRPFGHERGMCAYVWGPRTGPVDYRQLRWKAGKTTTQRPPPRIEESAMDTDTPDEITQETTVRQMDVFEIEWQTFDKVDGDCAEDERPRTTHRLFRGSKAEALREVKAIAADTDAPAPIDPPTVYRCELACTTRKATVFALLNGEIQPVRKELVHGTIPLPFRS